VVRHVTYGLPVVNHRDTRPSSSAHQSRDALLAFNRYGRAYFQHWLLIGVLIGAVAGIGAIIFASAIALCTHLFRGGIAGFTPPAPTGEGASRLTPIARPWLLPLVTTLGGLLTGLIVFTLAPEAEGHGTDAAIEAFHKKGGRIHSRIPLVKLVASAITIGSGGVFGPGMVIGGFLGGAVWAALHAIAPGLVAGTNAGAFAVVGMGAFFGGIAKAPPAVILMVAEMTGEYSLIAPAMLATMVAYLSTGDTSIYESQVPTRLDSPAHKNDYALPLLQSLTVRDAVTAGAAAALATASPDAAVADLSQLFRERHVASIPILDADQLVGMVTPTDLARLARLAPATAEVAQARQVMSRAVVRAFPDQSLYQAWLHMSRRGLRQLPIVDSADPDHLLGMVTAETIGRVLRAATNGGDGRATRGRRRTDHAAWSTATPASGGVQTALAAPDDADFDAADDGLQDKTPPFAAMSAREVLAPSFSDGRMPAISSHQQNGATPFDPMRSLRVADAMLKTPRLVRETDPIAIAQRLLDERGAALMVVDDLDRLVGIVTRFDLRTRPEHAAGRPLTVGYVAVRNLVTARPDETLQAAVGRMSRLGLRQLPVVDGPLPARPLGLLRRGDVLDAYERAPRPTISAG
jgi:CIC family chloride channel protein